MFFDNLKPKHSKLEEELSKREKDIDALKERVKYLENLWKDKQYQDIQSSKFALDFAGMNVVALERNRSSDGYAVTIVGHLLTDGTTTKIKEYYLYCSHDEHMRIVEEFNKYLKAKK